MRQFLEHLEKTIQTFFETSIRLIPSETANNRMVMDIVNQVSKIILNYAKENQPAPHQFEIYIHPDDLDKEFHSPYWVDEITQAIQEAAIEPNFFLHNQIQLQLKPDNQIPRGKAVIRESFVGEEIEKTAVMQLSDTSAPVVQPASPSAFLILPDNQFFPLSGKIVQIGRKKENDLVVDLPTISRHHAQIRLIQGQYVIFDLGSTGGVYVNGIKTEKAMLKQGDVIGLSEYSFIYGEDSQPNQETLDEQTTELPKFVDKE